MSIQPNFLDSGQMDRLAATASALGYEIVDIAGFLDLVDGHAKSQRSTLIALNARTADIDKANSAVMDALETMTRSTDDTARNVRSTVDIVRSTSKKTKTVAGWVQKLSERTDGVSETLCAVKTNNQQIASIASQVNTLAINAKIEAARAGEAGLGFAVVAEAINELSQKTRDAAVEISDNIETLTSWIAHLGEEAVDVAQEAADVLEQSSGTDASLGRMEQSVESASSQSRRIASQAERMQKAITEFRPALDGIDSSVKETSSGIEETHARIQRLIDTSESIVQSSALLGGTSTDGPFIDSIRRLATDVSSLLETAVEEGRISMSDLFDREYRVIPGSIPEQYLTRATELLDDLLPQIQEPALQIDPSVVFCAAVDVNGYLPTHNKKFSQPPSSDPVWNTANCRNRRIFNDRVGLKSGRNTEPFLLQVYRRDMGGGEFKMMKDLSAPIMVNGQHWGGLRLAYSY